MWARLPLSIWLLVSIVYPSPTPVSQAVAIGDCIATAFPLVQGLTDCFCNFSVMAFYPQSVSVFDTRCSPQTTQKLHVLIYWWLSLSFFEAFCQFPPKKPLRSNCWSPSRSSRIACMCAHSCAFTCFVCRRYWMLWILNKEMNTQPPYFHTNTVSVFFFFFVLP